MSKVFLTYLGDPDHDRPLYITPGVEPWPPKETRELTDDLAATLGRSSTTSLSDFATFYANVWNANLKTPRFSVTEKGAKATTTSKDTPDAPATKE